MWKRLCLSAMVGFSVLVGSMTVTSAADVWAYTGRPQHRECTSTDYYIITESIEETRDGFCVDVKMVNQPMDKVENISKWKFFDSGVRPRFEGPRSHKGYLDDSDLARNIYIACQSYR